MNLKEMFALSERGVKDLKKGIAACTLTNLSLMLSVCVTIEIFAEIFKPLAGSEISWNRLWLLFIVGIVVAVITFMCSRNDYRKTYIASYKAAEDSRIRIAELIRKYPMSVFNSKSLSELTTNMMADCASIEHSMSHIVPPLFASAISSTLICVGIMFFDWRMALAIFCTLPLSFLIVFGSKKVQEHASVKQVEAKLNAAEKEQDYLEGIKIIKSCKLDGEKFQDLKKALWNLKQQSIHMEMKTSVLISIAQLVLQAGIGITVFVGIYCLSTGSISVQVLLLSLVIVCRIYGPILTILTLLPMLFHTLVATRRMRELSHIPVMEGESDISINDYHIKFKNVSFAYNSDNVISDVTVTIPQGKITALVGPSGSGKSTMSRLIARFWDPNRGSIKLGDIDVKKLDPEFLMEHMAFVFQDVTLFNDTILNNIRIGNMEASEEEIINAAKAACCDEFVMNLPQGYQTILSENGNNLSGGERQRISIARALLKDAPVILLDEATASLDPENEVLIQRAISKLIEGKTVLVIAHRLRTIADADKIIVLKSGKVVEEGNHDYLINKRGLYREMYEIQSQSQNWSVS